MDRKSIYLVWGEGRPQVTTDEEGITRFVHYDHSIADIQDNSELLKQLDREVKKIREGI